MNFALELFPLSFQKKSDNLVQIYFSDDEHVPQFEIYVNHLLKNSVNGYVLKGRFCQDPLENNFSRQREMGCQKKNPSMQDFGFHNNIRNQKHFSLMLLVMLVIKLLISNEPLPCHKKPRKV